MAKAAASKGPKFVQFFGPVLQALDTLGGSGRPIKVRNWIAEKLKVSDAERTDLLKGGALLTCANHKQLKEKWGAYFGKQ